MPREFALLSTLLLIAFEGFAAPSAQARGFYARFDAGVAISAPTSMSFPDQSTDPTDFSSATSAIGSIGVGYRFTFPFRVDGTISYLPSLALTGHPRIEGSDVTDKTKVDSLIAMVNGYLDFKPFGRFRPYVDGGIGVTRNATHHFTETAVGTTATVSLSDETRLKPAWSVGAGIAVAVAKRVTVDIAYRYIDLGEIRQGTALTLSDSGGSVTVPFPDGTKAPLEVHLLTVGVRVGF